MKTRSEEKPGAALYGVECWYTDYDGRPAVSVSSDLFTTRDAAEKAALLASADEKYEEFPRDDPSFAARKFTVVK